jgi:hypothetical protein
MDPLKPDFDPDEFKTAAPEVLNTVPLAFKDGSFFKDDVLDEQDAD